MAFQFAVEAYHIFVVGSHRGRELGTVHVPMPFLPTNKTLTGGPHIAPFYELARLPDKKNEQYLKKLLYFLTLV